MGEKVTVECYAGYQAEQEPRFIHLRGERLRVLAIAKRWYEPEAACFRVRVEDGHTYTLRYDQQDDAWTLTDVARADG